MTGSELRTKSALGAHAYQAGRMAYAQAVEAGMRPWVGETILVPAPAEYNDHERRKYEAGYLAARADDSLHGPS